MDITLTQAFYAAFMLFGVFSVLNAYLDKWIPSVVMFLMMLIAFGSGVLQGLSAFWGALLVGVAVLILAMFAIRMRASRQRKGAIEGSAENAAEISARMLEQMNRTVAERKARK